LGHMDRLIGEILSRDSQLPCPFWLHYGPVSKARI
jgi:hypothetical protein